MRVLVLTPSLHDTSPGARFRIEQWARYLGGKDIEFTFAPFEDQSLHDVIYRPGAYLSKGASILTAFARRLRLVGDVRQYDVVYLYREAAILGPALIERSIARHRVPIVYDFDDPIWLPYSSPTNRLFSRFKWQSKVRGICELASQVVVGNRLLAAWASQHSSHVTVIPTTIDLAGYPARPADQMDRPVTLGWTGSHSTLPFLSMIKNVLRDVADLFAYRLLVISHTDAYTLDVGRATLISRRWASSTEASDLQELDIGLAPFPDSGWTPWRCHGKVIQYMALGIPPVASSIGILPEYISDGVNGLLASTADDWIRKLSLLIEHPDLRSKMGLAARQTVREKFSAEVWAPRVRDILVSAANS